MKNKIIAYSLLITIIFFNLPIVVFSDNTTIVVTISSVNTGRGENQIILYDKHNEVTGTNEWGYEIVVTNGRVSSIGGNNNLVPNKQNSYVISAHGTAVEKLYKIEIGMKAVYDSKSKTVKFSIDNEGIYTILEIKRFDAISARNNALENFYIIDETAETLFNEAENKYKAYISGIDIDSVDKLIADYERITLLYRDVPASEYRGIWIRPNQKNEKEVEAFVRKCCLSGLNMISVEILYDCTFICPMPEDSYFEQNPYFENFDVLAAFSKMCNKYGVELHAWMHTFAVGDPNSVNLEQSIITKRPEWRLADSNGNMYDYFLNPALNEVQDYLIDTYEYILETYDIDAFQLDTIRYPALENGIDYGYDAATISLFKKEFPQYEDMSIVFDTDAVYWKDWASYRKSNINKFVERVHILINEVAPDVLLSADVNAVLNMSPDTCYQDSAFWLSQGWLDMVHPMAYGANDDIYVKRFIEYAGENCWVVPALGAFVEEFDRNVLLEQTQKMLEIGCNGVAYFAEMDFFGKNCDDILVETIFNKTALPPVFNNANTAVAEVESFIQRLQLAHEQGVIDKNNYDVLIKKANTIIKDIKVKGTEFGKKNLSELESSTVGYVSNDELLERLLLDLNAALHAILRNITNDKYCEMTIGDILIPQSAVGQIQLTIDKVNSSHIGEDSILISNPLLQDLYNVKYTYVMLFECVDKTNNIYRLIEAHQNYGIVQNFDAVFTDDMIMLSFHSNDVGEGVERRDLARTVQIGTEMVLWGITLDNESFSALRPMMYIYTPQNDMPAEDSSDIPPDTSSESSEVTTSDKESNDSNTNKDDVTSHVSEAIKSTSDVDSNIIVFVGIFVSIVLIILISIFSFIKSKKSN